ncbi:hypothetical protein GCM10022393_22850 [Aquimarina addita]|uniref:T9SS C-terminal target domain-containing protein n=2 Tax=Aquimarina addita TaxID=870485 RepID=A0ABP6UM76_9FLAO
MLVCSKNVRAQDQNFWWSNSYEESTNIKTEITGDYSVYHFNTNDLKDLLKEVPFRFSGQESKHIINFPDKKNKYKNYVLKRTAVMHPYLAAKYQGIFSYIGYAEDDPSEIIHITYSQQVGLQGSIVKSGSHTVIIKPSGTTSFGMYNTESEVALSAFECQLEETGRKSVKSKNSFLFENANDGNLRRYRLALSVTGEYSQYFLDGTEANDEERRTKIMTAMVASINRVNGIFERDFSVTMQIIPENDSLIFLDQNTDPYATGSQSLNSELQSTIDNDPLVGSDAYDVGHLFQKESSTFGNAGCIACVCIDGAKGSAFTAHVDPSSDNFNMIVAHEFGHQFGGYHVQSSSNCRSGFNSEVEPGSGSSIMGYAGICPTNVQNSPDDYFNYVDIRDISIWTIDNSDCAEILDTGNTAPQVDAGNDYIIPVSTPFVLEGNASDINGDSSLTYCWEQNDPENPGSSNSPQSDWRFGPLFRSKLPTSSNKRYMPQLEDVLTGNLTPTWEVLPAVDRSMRFELTVRDNTLNGGQSNTDGIDITVNNNAGPFVMISQNTSETLNVGELVTISWDVANTDIAPINCSTVDILLSLDGGYTYPVVLQDNTTNDGTETFILPNIETTVAARIMVKASDNIFFAVNSANLQIQQSEFIITTANSAISVCQSDNVIYNIDYKTFLDFDDETTFSTENLPLNLQADFDPVSVSGSQTDGIAVTLEISGTENLTSGSYEFIVKGNSASGVEKVLNLTLEIYEDTVNLSTLSIPADTETGVNINGSFEWSEDPNVEDFTIEIATDEFFMTLIESATIQENQYTASNLEYNTTYFWRINSKNPCGVDLYSEVSTFSTQCADPLDFQSVLVRSSTVALSWVDEFSSSWDIEYGLTGFELGKGISISTTESPTEVTGLDSSTTYDFYLKSNCSIGGAGIWIGPLSITTTPDYCAGDYFYDQGGPDGDYPNNTVSTTVISPDVLGERVRVVFNSFNVESGYDFLQVFDGPDNTYPQLFVGNGYTGSDIPTTFTSTDVSGSLTFMFFSDISVTSSGWDAQVICESKPNCEEPEQFLVSEITTDEATVSWQQPDASVWELEYGVRGFTLGTGIVNTISSNSYNLINLESSTSYDVYIKTVCDEGGFSNVRGPLRFMTACNLVSDNPNEYLINQSFECGDIGAWRINGPDNSLCPSNFDVYEDSSQTCFTNEILPSDGAYAAYTSFDGNAGDEFTIEQSISVPDEVSNNILAMISYDFKVSYNMGLADVNADRTFTASLVDSDNNTIKVIDVQSFGLENNEGTLDLTITSDVSQEIIAYAGELITIRFAAYIPESYTGPASAMLDNVSLTIEEVLVLSTEDNKLLEDNIVIAPNPNNGSFMLTYQGENQLKQALVYDITGKLIQNIELSPLNKQQQIGLLDPEAGIYFVNFISSKGSVTKKISVK